MGLGTAVLTWGVKLFDDGIIRFIGDLSGVVTLISAGNDMRGFLKENHEDNEAFSEILYRMLDDMDSNINLYDSREEREATINYAFGLVKDKNLNPIDILSNLDGLMSTGGF